MKCIDNQDIQKPVLLKIVFHSMQWTLDCIIRTLEVNVKPDSQSGDRNQPPSQVSAWMGEIKADATDGFFTV
jgi:hypothetical protein